MIRNKNAFIFLATTNAQKRPMKYIKLRPIIVSVNLRGSNERT